MLNVVVQQLAGLVLLYLSNDLAIVGDFKIPPRRTPSIMLVTARLIPVTLNVLEHFVLRLVSERSCPD